MHLLHRGCCSPVLPAATALHLEEVHVVSRILWLFMRCIFSRKQRSWPEDAGLRSGSRGELRRMLAAGVAGLVESWVGKYVRNPGLSGLSLSCQIQLVH